MSEAFEPTPKMRARHAAFVEDMVTTVWNLWIEDGQVSADPDKASQMIAFVRSEWEVSSRPEWMHPLDSIAIKVLWADAEEQIPSDQRTDYFDALRTSEGIGERERRRWVAQATGVSMAQISSAYGPKKDRAPVSEGPTALYRHFDRNNVLLYVGITWDLVQRAYLHAHTSEWYPHSVRCEAEWLDDRAAALMAEREAIRLERPLFNKSQSIADPKLAEAYMRSRA